MQIEMIRRRFGYFPRVFISQGKEHEVTSVERCWTTGHKKMQRHYFNVTCLDGTFQLFQDLTTGTWHIVQ